MTRPFIAAAKGVEIDPEKEPRPRSDEGSVYKKVVRRKGANGKMRDVTVWYARQRYTDKNGKDRELKRTCPSQSVALTKLRELQDKVKELLAESEPKPLKQDYTFAEFAAEFDRDYIKPAVIVNGKKLEGYKSSLKTMRSQIEIFCGRFGERSLSEITYDDIRSFQVDRLKRKIVTDYFIREEVTPEMRERLNLNSRQKFIRVKKQKIKHPEFSTVNREFVLLRRIFKIAVRKKAILSSPFDHGEPMIKASLENVRMRIATFEEEQKLYAACYGKSEHLKMIITFAIDTAMRNGEIFKIKWENVDFANNLIKIPDVITKTGQTRNVPMTSRVKKILQELQSCAFSETVFGVSSCVSSWETVRARAKLFDLTFHDLRATAITRMLRAGIPIAEVMKISGHSEYSTFMKYVRQDAPGAQVIAGKLDSYISENQS